MNHAYPPARATSRITTVSVLLGGSSPPFVGAILCNQRGASFLSLLFGSVSCGWFLFGSESLLFFVVPTLVFVVVIEDEEVVEELEEEVDVRLVRLIGTKPFDFLIRPPLRRNGRIRVVLRVVPLVMI